MELLVYKASAGSGKTFTLTVEYIKRLLLNPRAYRNILAVTFTNKATTEMKERILQQLYGLHEGNPASDAYLKRLTEDLAEQGQRIDEASVRRQAGMTLRYILHDYNRFRVETIDSFFQSVMRNLARELELNPNLNIELDNDKVLSEAVDGLIEELTLTSPVMALLLDYIDERIADDKRWNVADEIKRFSKNIFNENYIERGGLLREKLRNPQALRLYRETLQEMGEKALQEMKSIALQFEDILRSNGLSPGDLKGGQKGIGSYFSKLKNGKLTDKEVLNATLANCLEQAENWAARTSPHRDTILALANSRLIPLLEDAEQKRPDSLHAVHSSKLSLQHLNKLQLLNYIDEKVRRLNHEQNRFLLSDTNALLHRLIGEGDSSFIFEKIGANIHHVMIDEFQDTSRMQWANFRLLLAEGLSQGDDSLIVGDVKQSIYRWRNGDWTILNGLKPGKGALTQYVHVKSLNPNRRSETRVIRFNNHFFTSASAYFDDLHRKELNEPCRELTDAYADVVQQSPKKEELGYVKVQLLEADDANDYAEQTLQALGNEVLRLLAEGVCLNDLAILVRKNKNIPLIATYFSQELNLPVVSDEAFRLDASPAVCLLIDALRCLTSPDDNLAQASLLMNSGRWIDEKLPEAFLERQDELRSMPLYEALEEISILFGLEQMEGQAAYLFAFFDAVSDYLKGDNPNDGFLAYWEESLRQKTIHNENPAGIRIFSIHKSKGLEFHTILIPFCDWNLENETNNQLVWCIPEESPYNLLDLVPVTYSAAMATSTYRKDYLNERLQLWVDNLNLLYVAFTRAEKNLICWSKQGQKNTVADLLAHVLPDIAQEIGTWDEEDNCYTYGELCPSASKQQANPHSTETNRLTAPPAPLSVRMTALRPDIEFRQSNRSADFIAGVQDEESPYRYIDRGRLLHTLFSNIRTTADIDAAIDRLVFEGVIAETSTIEEIRELTHRAFSLPQVQEWYSGKWTLFSECNIIWMENGKLQTRRPDRVMTAPDGQVVVVDFKFGRPNQKYNKQVRNYIDLLVRMGYKRPLIEGYLWYVDESRIESV